MDEANIESHGVDFNWSKTLGNKAWLPCFKLTDVDAHDRTQSWSCFGEQADWRDAHMARVQRYVDA